MVRTRGLRPNYLNALLTAIVEKGFGRIGLPAFKSKLLNGLIFATDFTLLCTKLVSGLIKLIWQEKFCTVASIFKYYLDTKLYWIIFSTSSNKLQKNIKISLLFSKLITCGNRLWPTYSGKSVNDLRVCRYTTKVCTVHYLTLLLSPQKQNLPISQIMSNGRCGLKLATIHWVGEGGSWCTYIVHFTVLQEYFQSTCTVLY